MEGLEGKRPRITGAAHGREVAAPRLATPLISCLIFGVTLVLQLFFFDRFFAYMDEGHQLLYADIVANGGQLYRDATIYPLPGAFYLMALAFKIFGPSVILTRWIVALQFSLFCALVFLLVRKLVSLPYAFGMVFLLLLYRVWVFPHWQNYSYSTTSLTFLALSAVALVRFFDARNEKWLGLAGLLFGVGVACKQDYGAAMLIAGVTAIIIHARATSRSVARDLAWFVGAGGLVGALLGLYFLSFGLLDDLIQQTILGHMKGLAKFEYPEIPSLFPLLSQDPMLRDTSGIFVYWPGIIFTVDIEALRTSWLFQETALFDFMLKLFFYLPYALVAGGALRLWRRRSALTDDRTRGAYMRECWLHAFALGMVLVLTVNKPQDYLHFAVVYWPFLALALVYSYDFLKDRRTLTWVVAAALLLPTVVTSVYTTRLVLRLRDINSELLASERGGIRLAPDEVRMLDAVVAYVEEKTAPGEAVTVIPYFPFVQFLMDRPGVHRSSYIVWPFPDLPDRDTLIANAMEEQQVQTVIYNFTQFINFPLMSEYAPDLFRYLVDHYRMDEVFALDYSGYKLAGLQRETRPAPGRPLVEDPARTGVLRVDPAIGPAIAKPPRARAEYLAQDLWPFRPVMAVRPTADEGRTVFAVELDVPESARLVTAVGVDPREWFVHPSFHTSYQLVVVDAEGRRTELYSRTLKPHTNFDERGWFEVDVSLDAFAGQRVRLEFSTSAQLPNGESIWGGGWAQPRLVGTPRPKTRS